MEFDSQKRAKFDWLDEALCRGTYGTVTWHWDKRPSEAAAAPALALCAECPVVTECRQDLADAGDQYRMQVRGGLRLWEEDQWAEVPEPSEPLILHPGPGRETTRPPRCETCRRTNTKVCYHGSRKPGGQPTGFGRASQKIELDERKFRP